METQERNEIESNKQSLSLLITIIIIIIIITMKSFLFIVYDNCIFQSMAWYFLYEYLFVIFNFYTNFVLSKNLKGNKKLHQKRLK